MSVCVVGLGGRWEGGAGVGGGITTQGHTEMLSLEWPLLNQTTMTGGSLPIRPKRKCCHCPNTQAGLHTETHTTHTHTHTPIPRDSHTHTTHTHVARRTHTHTHTGGLGWVALFEANLERCGLKELFTA